MKRRKVDSQMERRLLTAFIMSDDFAAKATDALDLSLISEGHFKIVAEWCIHHYCEYGSAPKKHIEDHYHSWADDNEEADIVSAVHDFLETLSVLYEEEQSFNVPFLLDELSLFLTKRRLHKLQEDLTYNMSHGEYEEAEELVTSYQTVKIGELNEDSSPLKEDEVWSELFQNPPEPLIAFAGDAGRFFNAAMVRDSLVGIQAPEKTGKTFWCVEFAIQALRRRKKVAFFEVGDLSQRQVYMRLAVRFAQRPMWTSQCGDIEVPSVIEIDEDEDLGYRVEHTIHTKDKPLDEKAARRGLLRFKRACGLSKNVEYFKVSVHANGSINFRGIEAVLDRWKVEEGFIPDVIILDYMDIMAPEDPKKQKRDQVNESWMAARRLSQERHCLVIVPTQADAQSYTNELTMQSMQNFSEDKRKLGHVTGMLGLNQTAEEKKFGGMRLNWIVLREAPFNIQKPLYVGTCFTLGRALCCAAM